MKTIGKDKYGRSIKELTHAELIQFFESVRELASKDQRGVYVNRNFDLSWSKP